MSTAAETVHESGLVESIMTAELAERIKAAEYTETGYWIWDPHVDGVVGFQVEGQHGREVVVVLYLEQEDFDCNGKWAETGEL